MTDVVRIVEVYTRFTRFVDAHTLPFTVHRYGPERYDLRFPPLSLVWHPDGRFRSRLALMVRTQRIVLHVLSQRQLYPGPSLDAHKSAAHTEPGTLRAGGGQET